MEDKTTPIPERSDEQLVRTIAEWMGCNGDAGRTSIEWVPMRWMIRADIDADHLRPAIIELMTSPFYEGYRYSVRCGHDCLNTSGEWEYEPMPSSRDSDFYERCRFKTFQDAEETVTKWIEAQEGAAT